MKKLHPERFSFAVLTLIASGLSAQTPQPNRDALVKTLGEVIDQGETFKAFDHEKGRAAWVTFLAELEAIDRDLAVAEADPDFALELCLACWEHDWNFNGRIDERDKNDICRDLQIDRGYLRVLVHRAKAHFRERLALHSSR